MCRQEQAVQRFELEKHVGIRWESSAEEYQEALKILNCGKQQRLKSQILDIAKERLFYLNTLKHHTGMAQPITCSHRFG